MEARKKLIQSLTNVKLVVGNGFDLHCLLKSSYKDYFMWHPNKNKFFYNWLDSFKNKAYDYINLNVSNHKDFWVEFKPFNKVNVWDFYFYLLSESEEKAKNNNWLWYDIEEMMLESLLDYKKDETMQNIISWPLVYNIINNSKNCDISDSRLFILAAVCYKKHNEETFSSLEDFYNFLLNQLKEFEKEFGSYIKSQHEYSTPFMTYHNEKFDWNCDMTIQELCNPNNLVSIDSFNFDYANENKYKKIYRFINGNYLSPIFGVDSNYFSGNDPRRIFTKTSRRMEFDMSFYPTHEQIKFDNLIIYGHSLGKSDYSYFFSLFDQLEITNSNSKSKIVFAYTIYDTSKKDEIKSDIISSVSRLFEQYAISKEYKNFNRLLDSLVAQQKIIFYPVSPLGNPESAKYFKE